MARTRKSNKVEKAIEEVVAVEPVVEEVVEETSPVEEPIQYMVNGEIFTLPEEALEPIGEGPLVEEVVQPVEKHLSMSEKMRRVMNQPETKALVRAKVKEYWSQHEHPMKAKVFDDASKANMRLGHALRKAFQNKQIETAMSLIEQLRDNGSDVSRHLHTLEALVKTL